MATNFRVRNFIRKNPEWAVVLSHAFFVNMYDKDTLYPDIPTFTPICQIYEDVNGDILDKRVPIITDEYNSEVTQELIDIGEENGWTEDDITTMLEDICNDFTKDVMVKNIDSDLGMLIDKETVYVDEFGTKTIQISVKNDVNTIALAYSVPRMIKEIYNALV